MKQAGAWTRTQGWISWINYQLVAWQTHPMGTVFSRWNCTQGTFNLLSDGVITGLLFGRGVKSPEREPRH